MSKISPCLWFDGEAEAAAAFYVALLPDSRIDHVQRNVMDSPAGKKGSALVVAFTLAGQTFLALNGGMRFDYSPAISFHIDCKDQAEIDRLWAELSAGGKPGQCGWVQDRYGLSWQIVPGLLPKLLADPDPAKAQRVMQAMLQMTRLDIAGLQRAYDGPV
jgi:predicted 3-demethylubiquinone-9 3-methyltransferase (glyoxalase superfamily)